MANSYFEPCFNKWYSALLSAARPYLQNMLTVIPNQSRFGIDVSGLQKRHKVFTRVMAYFVLVYWRAWEHNTWYATEEDGCMQHLPLGSFVTDETIQCLLKETDCIQLDIRPLLRVAGIRPLPDGIGVMQINGNGDCGTIIFQVGKERRTDTSPETIIGL